MQKNRDNSKKKSDTIIKGTSVLVKKVMDNLFVCFSLPESILIGNTVI